MDPRPKTASTGSASGDRSLGTLFRDLSTETTRLFRQEVTLARLELTTAAKRVARDAVAIGLGGAVAAVGTLVLVACLVLALGAALDNYWLAALIVGVVLVAAGGFAAMRALGNLRQAHLAPQDTIQSLQTTQRWAGAKAAEVKAALTGAAADGGPRGDGTSHGVPVNRLGHLQHPAAPLAAHLEQSGSASRGQGATRSGGKPQQGLMKRTWHEIQDDDVFGQAAKVAYYAFLALPPALMVILSLTGYFGGEQADQWLTNSLAGALPGEAGTLIRDFVNQVVHENAPGPLSFGLLLAIWSASGVFMGLGDTLNVAYDVEDQRSWVKRRLIAIGVMVAFAVLFVVASVTLVAGPHIGDALGLGGAGAVIWNIVHWPLALLFVVAAFYLVYYTLPNRDQSDCKKTLLKAAVIVALFWLAATAAFRFYISNFGSYSETYGFIGAIIVLLLWMYVTGVVILAGGELASEMEEGA